MIGELNRRIIFKQWGSTQDPGGGAIAVLEAMYTKWAKVEPRNGFFFSNLQQSNWSYDYRIESRYEKTRITKSNMTIDYDGKRLAINSVSFTQEGNRKLEVLMCTTTDQYLAADIGTQLGILTFDYYGIGGEYEFISDSNTIRVGAIPPDPSKLPRDLRNKTIIGAFKDGIEFDVLLSGVPDVNFKQVLYIPSTGDFLWSIPFEPGEHALIQYI